MNKTIQDGPAREILRSTLFRGSKTALFYFLFFIGGIYITIEFVLLKELWSNSVSSFIICWFVPPTVIIFLSLYSRYSWSVAIHDTKLVVRDFSLNSLLQIPFQLLRTSHCQEMLFADIRFIFYLEKEYYILLNYRTRLGKYKVARREMNYSREHLIQRYGVPIHVIDAFEHSSNKALDDYTATGILMIIEEILGRYQIQKGERKQILKDLKNTDDFSFEHIARVLTPFAISQSDLDSIKDKFSDLDANILTPFLTTKLAVAQLKFRERGRGGAHLAARTNVVLILSDQTGSKKIYLKRFHQLSRADWQKLIHIFNEKRSGIRYLMPRLNYRDLSDPDFKPGCA